MTALPVHHKCMQLTLALQILRDTLTACMTVVRSIYMMSLQDTRGSRLSLRPSGGPSGQPKTSIRGLV